MLSEILPKLYRCIYASLLKICTSGPNKLLEDILIWVPIESITFANEEA